MLDLLQDVIGINRAGLTCHPYKFKMGARKGKYVYCFDIEEMVLQDATEEELRTIIAEGMLNERGAIFMVPAGSKNIDRRCLLCVQRAKLDTPS